MSTSITPKGSLTKAITSSLILGLWLHIVFISPLKEEAADMHERQLDPTDIVKVPYDLQRLIIYVLGVVFVFVVAPHGDRIVAPSSSSPFTLHWSIYLIPLSVICFASMILSGAPPLEHLGHTALAALYLTALVCYVPPVFRSSSEGRLNIRPVVPSKSTTISLIETLKEFVYLRIRGAGANHHEYAAPKRLQQSHKQQLQLLQDQLSAIVAQTTVALTLPCQILLLYDNGWQAQRWPIPVVLGASYGWMIGTTFGTAFLLLFPTSLGNKTTGRETIHRG